MSEENGNVYYEVGLAHCQAKPVLLVTDDVSTLKFDLRDHRAVVYSAANLSDLRGHIAEALLALREEPADLMERFQARLGGGSSQLAQEKLENTLRAWGAKGEIRITRVADVNGSLQVEGEDFEGKWRVLVDVNGRIRYFRRI